MYMGARVFSVLTVIQRQAQGMKPPRCPRLPEWRGRSAAPGSQTRQAAYPPRPAPCWVPQSLPEHICRSGSGQGAGGGAGLGRARGSREAAEGPLGMDRGGAVICSPYGCLVCGRRPFPATQLLLRHPPLQAQPAASPNRPCPGSRIALHLNSSCLAHVSYTWRFCGSFRTSKEACRRAKAAGSPPLSGWCFLASRR